MELDDLSYEEAFARLEAAIGRLETGVLSIDEMVREFETGMTLARLCNERLDAAELRISQLVRDDEGNVESSPFDDDSV